MTLSAAVTVNNRGLIGVLTTVPEMIPVVRDMATFPPRVDKDGHTL